MFDSVDRLFLGALTGFVFGFLLQKGGVTRYRVILGQFLLRDFTMLKIMLTAVAVGGVGIYGLRALGLDFPLHVKSTHLLANALGGLLFGAGMALLGYCPGTAVAALGDGSRHAWAGVLGMLAGAAVYGEVHPWAMTHVLKVGDYGKVTWPTVTGVSPFWLVALVVLLAVAVLAWLERRERRGLLAHSSQG